MEIYLYHYSRIKIINNHMNMEKKHWKLQHKQKKNIIQTVQRKKIKYIQDL